MMNQQLREQLDEVPGDDSEWLKTTRNGETQWSRGEHVIIFRALNRVGEQYHLLSVYGRGYRRSIGKYMTFKDAEDHIL